MSQGCALLILRSKVKVMAHGYLKMVFRTITDSVINLWSWNFIHLLPMSQGCALLILGSKGQRSRSWRMVIWKWSTEIMVADLNLLWGRWGTCIASAILSVCFYMLPLYVAPLVYRKYKIFLSFSLIKNKFIIGSVSSTISNFLLARFACQILDTTVDICSEFRLAPHPNPNPPPPPLTKILDPPLHLQQVNCIVTGSRRY